jgi:PAT family beta-lactamase induction signal transducer AmpG
MDSAPRSWLDSLALYARARLVAVLFMGFASGLPLALSGATLAFRMAELGVNLTTIGLFALVGTAYSLKFLWSPVIDRLPLPVLTRLFGRRRGWALLIQVLLALAIVWLGSIDPRADPWTTALAAAVVAFLSASQDIVIDAYRIELLKADEQGAGAAATQWGYRIGMLASGAGALYAAEFAGWTFAYALMAALVSVGMLTVLFTIEPPGSALPPLPGRTRAERVANWFQTAVVGPFADFTTRPNWLLILVFVVLYKFGDALAGVMATPFYVATGFTRIEVANVSKIFGVLATMAGVGVGGIVVYRLGHYRSLLVCGLAQMLSNLMYVLQALVGNDVTLLAATIGIENFSGGLGSAAFVAYLSGLCNVNFTATQYALLSSLATVGRTNLSAWGGWLASQLGWAPFFAVTTLAALPGLLLILVLMRRIAAPAPLRPALGDD